MGQKLFGRFEVYIPYIFGIVPVTAHALLRGSFCVVFSIR